MLTLEDGKAFWKEMFIEGLIIFNSFPNGLIML